MTGSGEGRRELLTWALLAIALTVGALARFYGLGGRPLAVDEYYYLHGVLGILETGLPVLPEGPGYYVRGPLLQVLTAAAVWLTGSEALGLRLVPALLGLGAVPLAYLYARRWVGGPGPLLVAAAVAFSSWEIEFSRFGRMYAGLQFFLLLFLLLLDRFHEEPSARRWTFVALAGAGCLLTHQLGVVVIPVVVAYLLSSGSLRRQRERRRLPGRGALAVTVLLLLAVGAVITQVDFRGMGVRDPSLPAEALATAPSGSTLRLPRTALSLTGHVAGDLVLLVVAAGLPLLALGLLRPERRATAAPRAWSWGFLVSTLFHQLVPALAIGVVLLRRYGRSRLWRDRVSRVLSLGGLFAAIFWIGVVAWAILAGREAALDARAVAGTVSALGLTREFLLGWPELYWAVLRPFLEVWPFFTPVLAAAVLARLLRILPDPAGDVVRDPAVLVIGATIFVGAMSAPVETTRYLFMFYPIALVALAGEAERIGRWGAERVVRWRAERRTASAGSRDPSRGGPAGAAIPTVQVFLVGALFLASGDFHPAHLTPAVAGEEISYRTGPYERYDRHWYQRYDFPAVGRFLEGVPRGQRGRDGGMGAERESDGAVVVQVNLPVLEFYAPRVDYVYLPPYRGRFWRTSRRRGEVELWSGLPLLNSLGEVRTATRCAPVVWLASLRKDPLFTPEEVWGKRVLGAERRFLTRPGRIEVTEVRLAPDPSCVLAPSVGQAPSSAPPPGG